MRFIQISDSHIGPKNTLEIDGVNPLIRFKKVLEYVSTLPVDIDFIVHTGDMTDDGSKRSRRLVEDLLSELSIPVFLINGNHDYGMDFNKRYVLNFEENSIFNRESESYFVDFASIRLLFINIPVQKDLPDVGYLPDGLFSDIENIIEQTTREMIIFMHFPPIQLDSIWLNGKMRLQNGDAFHMLLVNNRKKITAVFFGHVHQSLQVNKDGILYIGGGSTLCQFRAWPEFSEPEFDIISPGVVNLVHISKNSIIVKNLPVNF